MSVCTPSDPCHDPGCEFCDPAGYISDTEQPDPPADWPEQPAEPDEPLFVDVAALLDGGLPTAPPPVLLKRDDDKALLYAGKVNVLFGDPESGKTWVALAACVEALRAGRRAAIIDLDHNGATEILSRMLALGATPAMLRNPDLFRLAEPEDADHLIRVVHELRGWRPAAAVVDSVGELMSLLGLSSNSPDDYTAAHRRVMTPLAGSGAAVIAIDHLPKNDAAREHGQTGTLAKRRTVNGVSLRVTLTEPFTPGRGGACSLTVEKDRSGGVRANCPAGTGKNPPAGRFVMATSPEGTIDWRVTVPSTEHPQVLLSEDLAELDALAPPPTSQRDVKERCGWSSDRAMRALRVWRDQQKHN